MTPMFVDQYANDRISQRISAAEDYRRARVLRDRQSRTKRQTDVARPQPQARPGESAPVRLVASMARTPWAQAAAASPEQPNAPRA